MEQQEAQNQQNRAQLMAAQEVARQRAVSITSVPDMSASMQQNSLIDTRTLGKPEPFKGTAEEFPDWVFIFKAYMGCINPQFTALLGRAESTGTPLVNRSLTAQEEQLSHQLYYVLVMLLRGRALDVAFNVGSGEGVETYRTASC